MAGRARGTGRARRAGPRRAWWWASTSRPRARRLSRSGLRAPPRTPAGCRGPAIRPAERAPDGLITHTWYTRPAGGDTIPVLVTTASRRAAEATTVTLPPAEVLVGLDPGVGGRDDPGDRGVARLRRLEPVLSGHLRDAESDGRGHAGGGGEGGHPPGDRGPAARRTAASPRPGPRRPVCRQRRELPGPVGGGQHPLLASPAAAGAPAPSPSLAAVSRRPRTSASHDGQCCR